MTTATAEQKPRVSYPPEFEVEFGNVNNGTIMLHTFKKRLRGAFSLGNIVNRPGGGRTSIGDALGGMPDTPGIRLKICPRKGSCVFWDPLEKDPKLMERISSILRRSMLAGKAVTFVERNPIDNLDADRMKNLVCEIVKRHDEGDCKLTQGRLPTQEEIDSMPGDEYYDPWSNNRYKPRYRKDGPEWERKAAMQPY